MTCLVQRAFLAVSLALLISALPMRAQVRVGENTSMNLSANLSFGYNGSYSNQAESTHSLSPSGNADLSGFYYDPNFLSFDVQPFYEQSRANSASLSVFQSTGLGASASFFGGSNVPGTVTFSRVYNGSGQYAVPGQTNITTSDNSQNIGVAWGIHFPGYPNVNVQFTDGDNNSSIFGTSSEAKVHALNFGVHANDTLDGFGLTGGYQYNTTHAETPQFLIGEESITSNSSGNSFDVGVSHRLPLNGSASVAFSRSDINTEESAEEFNYSGTITTVNAGAGFQPIRNVNVGVNTQYTNNLSGMLYQSYVQSGTVVPSTLLNYGTDAVDVSGYGSYHLEKHNLTFTATVDHREQTVADSTTTGDTLSELVSYGTTLWRGSLNAVAGVNQNFNHNQQDSSSLGFFDNLSYQRLLRGFQLNGTFAYYRNTQTVVVGITSSGENYTVGIGHKLSPYSYMSINATFTNSTYSNENGAGNSGQAYSAALSRKRFSVSGGYSQYNGTSVLTPTGLTPVTSPILVPLQTVVLNGTSYFGSASTSPLRGLVLSASYSDAKSNTGAISATSQNSTRLLNGMLQYKVRKLWITGGYLRVQQGFSITGQPALSNSSFYFGVTRWFNFF